MKGFIRIKEAGRPEVLVNVNQITAIDFSQSDNTARIHLSDSGYVDVVTASMIHALPQMIEEALKE